NAAVKDGKQALGNPFFGAEKRLAPAESYVRISDEVIYDAGEIVYPSIIMVYHPDVILMGKSYTMPFFSGIKRDGVILVNSPKDIEFTVEESERLRELNVALHFFPATSISREVTGSELSTNVAMLGALLGFTGIVTYESLAEALMDRFGGKTKFVASGTTAVLDEAVRKQYGKKEKLIAANAEVLQKSYDMALAAVSAGASA
ncbi:MAG TPA: 2-oxoacid:acceptor oxidoreductase family protein, partial [Coriobacteriia bacterium]|nr:2-oxoacid:acceptor oxidoreductase family protein [Coriobacteriia bacterium]